jgi:RNA-directed DNA polymerase
MPEFVYRQRGYVHLDPPLNREAAQCLATTPEEVIKHPFYPFISYPVETQKIGKTPEGRVVFKKPKIRTIAYAAHGDSHIFAHYYDILSELYESVLRERGIHDCITAFRSLDGRRNIHFANEVFEFIRRTNSCAALAMDVTDFFGNLDHAKWKTAWSSIIQQDRLPDDHFAVFKAITRYCHVDREALYEALHVPLNDPRKRGGHRLPSDDLNRLCPPIRFRERVRDAGLLQINTSGKGIPQGCPISAVLSNIYMLETDIILNQFATDHGGLYRRYCDDILFVMPTIELRDQAKQMIEAKLSELGLEFNPGKTEEIYFGSQRPITGKPLQYLGFTFDGRYKRIRPASVARFYRKMRKGVLRAKLFRQRADELAGLIVPSPLKKKKLYRLNSYLGKKIGRNRDERRNFLSYAFDAARIMNDTGIKKQVKRHWKRLQEEIAKPLK